MRALILIAGALVLASCGSKGQTDNTSNVDENLTAENIVSNDVTAIDAVTGDAANMAAESDVNDIGQANVTNEENLPVPSHAAAKHQRTAPSTATTTNPDSVSNTSTSAASNSAE